MQRRLLIAGHTVVVVVIAIAVYVQIFGDDGSPGTEISFPAGGDGGASAGDGSRDLIPDGQGDGSREGGPASQGSPAGAVAGITDSSGGGPWSQATAGSLTTTASAVGVSGGSGGSGGTGGSVGPPDAQYSSSVALIAQSLGLSEAPPDAP